MRAGRTAPRLLIVPAFAVILAGCSPGGHGTTASGGTTVSGGTTGSGGTAGVSGSTGASGAGGAAGAHTDAGADEPINAAFAAQALTIASTYTSWGRVDDEWRWAPSLCRLPLPGIARPSESNDPATHGQKLYSVFVKNHDAYPAGPFTDQAVVKQSWTAELVSDASTAFDPGSYRPDGDASDNFYPYAVGDGGVYRAAQFAGLFIMFKLDPSTSDTDEGWVYATVSPAGTVTAAGRVGSCMACHEVATHERLFGVPTSPLQ